MGEVEWSASSSETNPMLGIGRQSKRQSIGIMWGLSCPTLAGGGWGRRGGGCLDGSGGSFWTGIDTRSCRSACRCHRLSRRCTCSLVKSVRHKGGDGAGGMTRGRRKGGWASCSLYLALVTPPTQPSTPPWGPRSLHPLGEVVHWRCQSQSLCQLGKHSSRWQNKHLANRSRDDTASDTVSSTTPNTSAGLYTLHTLHERRDWGFDRYLFWLYMEQISLYY